MITYDPTAARTAISDTAWQSIQPQLLAARQEVLADIALMPGRQGGTVQIPAEKLPLDAGFIDWRREGERRGIGFLNRNRRQRSYAINRFTDGQAWLFRFCAIFLPAMNCGGTLTDNSPTKPTP